MSGLRPGDQWWVFGHRGVVGGSHFWLSFFFLCLLHSCSGEDGAMDGICISHPLLTSRLRVVWRSLGLIVGQAGPAASCRQQKHSIDILISSMEWIYEMRHTLSISIPSSCSVAFISCTSSYLDRGYTDGSPRGLKADANQREDTRGLTVEPPGGSSNVRTVYPTYRKLRHNIHMYILYEIHLCLRYY